MEAFRTTEKITVDGKANEASWGQAQMVNQFTQFKPQPGTPSTQKTEVKIMYDDDALYIFAICYDKPEHVSKVLSQRDDFNANVDNYECELISFNNITINGTLVAGVLTPLASGALFAVNTNYSVTDGTNSGVLRTGFAEADYIGT